MNRWVRLLAVALVLGTLAGLLLWYQGLDASRDETVARNAVCRSEFQAVLAVTPTTDTTYAAIVGDTRAAEWTELLVAAGVPVPMRLAPGADVPPAIRLVVLTQGTAQSVTGSPGVDGGRMIVQVPSTDNTAQVGLNHTVQRQGPDVVATLTSDWAQRVYERRQGQPALRDKDTDGNGSIQPADLSPTPQDVPGTPESDLAIDGLLDAMGAEAKCPLPRTRGVPAGTRTVVVLTSDQDYNPDDVVEPVATRLSELGANATFLLTDPLLGNPPDLHVEKIDGRRTAPTMGGHLRDTILSDDSGLGLHPFTDKPEEIRRIADAFAAATGFRALTARNHHVLWSGYLEIPQAEAEAGVLLNLDWLPICDGKAPCAGFPGGSGRPMLFVDERSHALPIFQQSTTLDDYSLRLADEAGRTAAAATLTARGRALIETSAQAEVPMVVNAHPNLVILGGYWIAPLLKVPGVPTLSAEQWLAFVVHRRAARLTIPRCGAVKAELAADVELRHGF